MAIELPTEIAPIPGNPGGIRGKASRFTSTAEAILEAVSGLRTAIAETRNHDSDALDELAKNAQDVSDRLETLQNRYSVAGEALGGFAGVLETAQAQVLPLVQERDQSQASVQYLDGQITIYTDQRTRTTDVTELAELNRHLTSLHRRRNTQVGDISHAQAQFDRIVSTVREAGIAAAGRLRTAIDGDDLNDGLWDNVMGWVQEHAEILKTIRTIMQWVTTALSVLSFFIPVLAPFALAAGLLTAGLSLLLALAGEISWVDFALDALTVATFGVAAVATRTIGGVMTALKGTRVARLAAQGVSSPLRVVTGSFNGVLAGTVTRNVAMVPIRNVPKLLEVYLAKGASNAHFLRVVESARAGAGGPLDDLLIQMGKQEMFKIRLAGGINLAAHQIDGALSNHVPNVLDALPDSFTDNPIADGAEWLSERYEGIRESATWRVGS